MSNKKTEYSTIPYKGDVYSDEEMLQRSRDYREWLNKRRTVREFSDTPIPKEVIENVIMAASAAPSGANKQPWTFCIVSDPAIKKQIQEAAEKEEYENYHGRMSPEWIEDLAALETGWEKPFLEIAPWLIVVFKRVYEVVDGKTRSNYYVSESVGIACGFLLAALHHAGLVALTHTPSPMDFLSKMLKRPKNERAFLLIPVGLPAGSVEVPDISRKTSDAVIVAFE